MRRDPPDGRDERWAPSRKCLDLEDERGGARERVAPQGHRRRPRVARAPPENELRPGLSGDRGNDPGGKAARLQDGTLLDVHLEVAEEAVPAKDGARGKGPPLALRQGLADRRAVKIAEPQVGFFQAAGVALASQVGAGEPDALLLREPEDLDRKGKREAAAPDHLERGDGEEDPEGPVESPRVAHRVEMGTEEKRLRGSPGGGHPADQVGDRILPDRQARAFHPPAHERIGALHGRREEGPRGRPSLIRDAGKLVEASGEGRCGLGQRCPGHSQCGVSSPGRYCRPRA